MFESNALLQKKEVFMKSVLSSTLLMVCISIVAPFANAGTIETADCTMIGAPANGPSSAVRTVPFGASKVNGVGSIERTAKIGNVLATLGEAGNQYYVSFEDTKVKVYFVSAFEKSAMYVTPDSTFQVNCK